MKTGIRHISIQAHGLCSGQQIHRILLSFGQTLGRCGAKRRPAFLIGIGSGLIFFLLCWLLHRREALLRKNLALKA